MPQLRVQVTGGCGEGTYSSGHANLDVGRRCRPCPDTVQCEGTGETIETLRLLPNHWRLSNRTIDIRMCKDPAWRTSDLTPCTGNANSITDGALSERYCRPGHQGPLCRVCVAPGHYYDNVRAECRQCVATGLGCLWVPVTIFALLAAICVLAFQLMLELQVIASDCF